MWFLLKCAFALALLYLYIAAEENAAKAPAQPPAKVKAARVAPLKESPAAALQREAAERIAEAARDHCLANLRECAALLKAASGEFPARTGSSR
jgi:hypothetical protein